MLNALADPMARQGCPAATVVIVNYRNDADTLRLLRSLQISVNNDVECIIASNSRWTLEPPVGAILLQMPVNVGYARALNVAIERASSPYIVVLNPDVVATSEDIRKLVEVIGSHPEAGIVAPKLLNFDGSTQPSCRTDYSWYSPVVLRLFPRARHAVRHYMGTFDHQ